MAQPASKYLADRGLLETAPEALNEALRIVLQSMEPMAYGDAGTGLTPEEQALLRKAGLDLEPAPGVDPLAQAAVKYAAIVERSLNTRDAAQRLGVATGRIRQMIAERSLYSFLIDGNRYIPDFQFGPGNQLVPNIGRVNRALDPSLHPVAVYNWYHLPEVDLFLGEDIERIMSPLDWLKSGQDVERVVALAATL